MAGEWARKGRMAMAAFAVAACGGSDVSAEEPVLETRRYAFHSDPWINLHHFIYQWSRAELGLGEGRTRVPVPERDGPLPSGAAGEAWRAALQFYVEHVAERDHFDEDMLVLKDALVQLDGDVDATPPDVIEGIAERLATAMAVYLETWWPEHDADNRSWIAFVGDDVERYEQRWVETVSRLFGGRWLDGRLRVDASAYANWQGGYTSNGPAHTVIWSRDESLRRGLYGLELVFHESGHMSMLGAPLRETVQQIFREAGVDEPGNLRHTLLFATAGEQTVVIAEERGLPEHVPYIVEEGLTGFAGWSHLWPPVVEHWLPVVRGEGDPTEALRAIAQALR